MNLALGMDELPALGDLTAGGVLLLVVVLVLWGKLVPKGTMDSRLADKDAAMERMANNHNAETTELRESNAALRTVVGEQSQQIGELIGSIELPSKVMEALKQVAVTRSERA